MTGPEAWKGKAKQLNMQKSTDSIRAESVQSKTQTGLLGEPRVLSVEPRMREKCWCSCSGGQPPTQPLGAVQIRTHLGAPSQPDAADTMAHRTRSLSRGGVQKNKGWKALAR